MNRLKKADERTQMAIVVLTETSPGHPARCTEWDDGESVPVEQLANRIEQLVAEASAKWRYFTIMVRPSAPLAEGLEVKGAA